MYDDGFYMYPDEVVDQLPKTVKKFLDCFNIPLTRDTAAAFMAGFGFDLDNGTVDAHVMSVDENGRQGMEMLVDFVMNSIG